MVLHHTTRIPAIHQQQMEHYGYEDMFYVSDEEDTVSESSFEPLEPILPVQASLETKHGHTIPFNGDPRKNTPSVNMHSAGSSSTANLIIMPDEDIRITQIANTASEHIAALRLVADSVAQQRQLAALAILFHPFCWALMPPLMAGIYCFPYKGRIDLLTLAFITVAVLMVLGTLMEWAVAGYLDAAKKVGTWRWLYDLEEATTKKARGHDTLDSTMGDCNCRHVRPREDHQKRDIVLVARLDPSDEIIGTIILRIIFVKNSAKVASRSNSSEKRCLKTQASMPNCKAVIRAWTVKQSYRGAGIGAWMLKDTILLCLKYGWKGPEFAKYHANSVRVLPQQFNGWLDMMEARAKRRLSRDIAILSSTLEAVDSWALPDIL